MHVYPMTAMLDRNASEIMLYLGLMAKQATSELFSFAKFARVSY